MEKITSLTFYNSHTGEHIRTVALYKSELGYAILTESGDNWFGKTRLTYDDAIEYYNEQIKDIRNYLQTEQIIFNTK
jgi:hypothetical protein